MRWRLVALAITVGACSEPTEGTTYVWDPYPGPPAPPAYPNMRPKLALPDGPFALVPSGGVDAIALVDLTQGATLASAPVGRDPVNLDGPHQIVADRSRGLGFVILSYP